MNVPALDKPFVFGTPEAPRLAPASRGVPRVPPGWTGIGAGYAKSVANVKRYATSWARSKGGNGVPADHPRRCTAIKKTGERCWQTALVISGPICKCKWHFGHSIPGAQQGLNKLPRYYSAFLGPKLKDKLEELQSGLEAEQLKLYEEIAIARALVLGALQVSAPVLEPKTPEEAKKITPELVAGALALIREATSHLRDLVQAQASLEQKNSVPNAQIGLVVQQMILAVGNACGDRTDIAGKLLSSLEQLRLPSQTLDPRAVPDVQLDLIIGD